MGVTHSARENYNDESGSKRGEKEGKDGLNDSRNLNTEGGRKLSRANLPDFVRKGRTVVETDPFRRDKGKAEKRKPSSKVT